MVRVSGRQLLASAATVTAATGLNLLPGGLLAATDDNLVYYLDLEWGAGLPACPVPHLGGGPCHACNACHGHAAKMFVSATLADARRAHRHCKCIVRSKSVSVREYVSIFGPLAGPRRRQEFDPKRDEFFLPQTPAGPPGK